MIKSTEEYRILFLSFHNLFDYKFLYREVLQTPFDVTLTIADYSSVYLSYNHVRYICKILKNHNYLNKKGKSTLKGLFTRHYLRESIIPSKFVNDFSNEKEFKFVIEEAEVYVKR